MSDARTAGGFDAAMGMRVRARRLEIGMSQERLAELLGVTFQQVQKYEKGVNRIAASRLWDIAHALGCGVVDLYPTLTPRDAASIKPRLTEHMLACDHGVRLAKLFVAAPAKTQAAMFAASKAIAEAMA